VPVVVQNARGRSRAASLQYLATLKALSLDPPGALPGDEVVLAGEGFAPGTSVSVGGKPATVVEAAASTVRFLMPDLQAASGSTLPVIAKAEGRSTAPLQLYFGRVPIVSGFTPERAIAGELVRVRGVGFAPAAEDNAVTFDGVPALVAKASPSELVVVAPPAVRAQAETLAQVIVRARGRASTDGASFPLLRLVEGTWVPRFAAGAVAEGARGQAVVGTEIAPAVLLASADGRRSVAERALQLATALNTAVDQARVGQKVAFEAREAPSPRCRARGQPRSPPARDRGGRGRLRRAAGAAAARGAARAGAARAALGRAAERHPRDRHEQRCAQGRRRVGARRGPRLRRAARGAAVPVRLGRRERARRRALARPAPQAARGRPARPLTRDYRPSASRSASGRGRPASRIRCCVRAISYATR
jgi:hypothetical protein